MRKLAGIVLVGAVGVLFTTLALAEYMERGPRENANPQEQMDGKREMMMRMEKMGQGAKGMSQLVATTDGGVIVMVGNRLLKYDTNLNLIKETEIKVKENMQKMPMEPRPMMEEKERQLWEKSNFC